MASHSQRRVRERKELRLRILHAAGLLFGQGGESAVTLRRVGEAIEFSATTIYSHFPDKEALVLELCALEFEPCTRSLQVAEGLPHPMDRLRKVTTIYADFGLQHPEHYRMLFMRAADRPRDSAEPTSPKRVGTGTYLDSTAPPEISPAVPPERASPFEFLQRAVFKAMAAGCFKPEYRDVDLIAQVIWSCLHGVVALHLVRSHHARVTWKPVQSILDATVESLFNGLTIAPHQSPPTWRR